jgi:photosystem II stability/assembly factor-like uncharacterized protein
MTMPGDSSAIFISSAGNRISTNDAGVTWNNDQINPFTIIYPEHFLNPNEGFIETMLADRSSDRYHARTSDGGHTWLPFECSNPGLKQFIHTSSNISYAIPESSNLSDTIVMKTTDRGATWSTCLLATLAGFSDKNVRATSSMHRGDDTVYVAFRDKGTMVWTTNGGASWSLHTIPRFRMMNMRQRRYSWGITDSLVMRSSDDGLTWESVLTLPSDALAFRKLIVFSGESIAVSSQRVLAPPFNVDGYMHRSTDGGSTWATNPVYLYDILQDEQEVPFLTKDGLGYSSYGRSNMQGGYSILLSITTDFWETSTRRYITSSTASSDRLVAFNRDLIWLIMNGRIYSTESGGIDAIEPPAIPFSSDLAQNYPNPFSFVTSIPYRIEGGSPRHALLELYDIMGRRVKTLFDNIAEPGDHVTSLNAAGLQPGMYFVRFTSGKRMAMRKILVN